jgi:hypothetical protein
MLKSFYSILSLIFLMAIGLFQPAFSADPKACGIAKKCADGYYCTGAIGDSNSGVCVANALNTVMCRSISYVQSDIITYFFLFGAVFAGIYMLVGKFTMVTFIQIVLGIGVLKGATVLMTQITGSSVGVCSQKQALNCIENTQGSKPHQKETIIRNFSTIKVTPSYVMSGGGTSCSPLECVKAKCQKYNITRTTVGQTTSVECELSEGVMDAQVPVAQIRASFKPTECQASFSVTCTPVVGSFERDYFKCTSCVDEEFVAEAPSSWEIKDCKDLVKKQIK